MTQASELMTHHLSGSEVLPGLVKDILGKGAECRLEVKGYSMSPFIKDGDIITISSAPGSLPRLGDVVAFVHPRTEKLLIHRIVWKSREAYLLKGENAPEPDGLIKNENILGFVTKVERKGKNIFLGLGPERFLIALLSRKDYLLHVLRSAWRMLRPIARMFFQ